MALVSAGVPFEEVSPAKWQRALSLPTAKQAGGDKEKKHAHRAMAQHLYPDLRVTLATCDALLVMEYAKRLKTNTLTARK